MRDVGVAVALGVSGATTVASTSALAHRAGIAVFATGGLGGVHRGAAHSFDVSADLGVLASTPVLVVCAGVKSILDVPGTLEYLETLSVPVIGYRTDAFPGFYLSDSGEPVTWRVDTPEQAAAIVLARRELATDRAGVVLANPLPPDRQLDRSLHDATLADGLAMLAAEGVTGKDVTPRLLEYFHAATHGASLRVNVDLVLANAGLAGEVAVAAGRRTTVGHPGMTRPHVTVVGDVGLDVVGKLAGPVVFGHDTRARVTVTPGGAGGNTAAWLARHEVDVSLIARVGADEAGRTAAAELTAAGIDCRFAVDPDAADLLRGRAGRAGRRPDHARRPRRERRVLRRRRAACPQVAGRGHLHLSGYVLLDDGSRPAGLAALGSPHRAGWTTSVDPQAAVHIATAGAENFLSWVSGADLLLPNDAELAALGGLDPVLAAVGGRRGHPRPARRVLVLADRADQRAGAGSARDRLDRGR